MFNVIIPAHNEEDWIGATLDALLAQDASAPEDVRVIVAANGCDDRTVKVAKSFESRVVARGWTLKVLDLPVGRKTLALNAADAEAQEEARMYVDADVICSPALLGQIAEAIEVSEARYASGDFRVAPSKNWFTRRYVNLWTKLPFMTTGVPGGGLFAMNAAGRARWTEFPDVIADDSFARLQFLPEERIGVPAAYETGLAEGFAALVRMRRRWITGNRQLGALYPELLENDDKPSMKVSDHLRLFIGQPVSYVVYVAISIAARWGAKHRGAWIKGR